MKVDSCYRIIKCKNKFFLMHFDINEGVEKSLLERGADNVVEIKTKTGVFIFLSFENYKFVAFYDYKKEDIIWHDTGIEECFTFNISKYWFQRKKYIDILLFKNLNHPEWSFFSPEFGKKMLGEELSENVFFYKHYYNDKFIVSTFELVDSKVVLSLLDCREIIYDSDFIICDVEENLFKVFLHNGRLFEDESFFLETNGSLIRLHNSKIERESLENKCPIAFKKTSTEKGVFYVKA